ncbi:hypothetical protein LLG95_01395 [bacterium]|nr:hypothetical protein [bacterium]
MRIAQSLTLIAAVVLLTGCVNFRIGTETEMPDLTVKLPGSAYADYVGVPAYSGTILHGAILPGGERSGELIALHMWPIGGLDLGLIGARVNILGAEAGAGTLLYAPGALKEPYE